MELSSFPATSGRLEESCFFNVSWEYHGNIRRISWEYLAVEKKRQKTWISRRVSWEKKPDIAYKKCQ